jgi:hypothetical protein
MWDEGRAPRFKANPKGLGHLFSSQAADEFLKANGCELLVRGHQAVWGGYEFPFYPQKHVVTVFSASNFWGAFGNMGGVLLIDASLLCSCRMVQGSSAESYLGR